MKFLKTLILVALIPINAMAADGPSFYGRIDTGASFSTNMDRDLGSDNAGTSAIVGGGIGYQFNDHIRADATLGYRGWYKYSGSTPFDNTTFGGSADISNIVGLVNAYYDIGHFDRFTPYIGGGIGFSSNDVDTAHLNVGGVPVGTINSHNNTSFAWQLGAGTAVTITNALSLDVGYRYLDMGTAETGDIATVGSATISGATLKGNLRANELQVGLRYAF